MSSTTKNERLKAIENTIASYPDFPKPGIIFKDFFPILRDPEMFADLISLFTEYLEKKNIKANGIVGLDSRGFILGPVLAQRLKVPFIPVRKPGKLPGKVAKEAFQLEYGSDALEIQREAIQNGMKIVIVDDMVATGGSMQAAVKLVEKCGGHVVQCLAVMEIKSLDGAKKITAPVHCLIQY